MAKRRANIRCCTEFVINYEDGHDFPRADECDDALIEALGSPVHSGAGMGGRDIEWDVSNAELTRLVDEMTTKARAILTKHGFEVDDA